MTYSEIYNQIYSQLKDASYLHEHIHSTSIKITDALWKHYLSYGVLPSITINNIKKEN
jgi:hypothetical protein